MNARPDLERVVTDWLHDEAVSAGSDRVLAATLIRVAGVGQERTPRLVRIFDMNGYAKLALGVAAVAVVAVVGINLLPAGDSGVGGPVVSPSPSPSPTPQASPSPSPAAAFPPAGPLSVGAHTVNYDGIPMSFSIPTSGWRVDAGSSIGKGEYEQPDWIGIDFWLNAPDNVYADLCAHTALDPKPASPADLINAVASLPGTDLVVGPQDATIGGRSAQHVAIKIREDIGCEPHDAWLWYDESSGGASGGWRWAEGLGTTYRIWVADVDGKVVWIDAYTFPGADPELDQEIDQIIASMRFG
jgi:hypothetical protein